MVTIKVLLFVSSSSYSSSLSHRDDEGEGGRVEGGAQVVLLFVDRQQVRTTTPTAAAAALPLSLTLRGRGGRGLLQQPHAGLVSRRVDTHQTPPRRLLLLHRLRRLAVGLAFVAVLVFAPVLPAAEVVGGGVGGVLDNHE